jgi:hypothetical protein
MPETLILEFTGVSEAEYAAVNKHLGIRVRWVPLAAFHQPGA